MTKITIPRRTVDYYIRLATLLALLIVVAGFAVQSVQVNLFAQSEVEETYAQAVAEQMSKALKLRLQDTRRLQLAASAQPQTLAALHSGDAAWLQTLKSVMPGSLDVLLISPQQEKRLHLSYGFAVQELVARTLKGNQMRLEALQKPEQGLRLYWATPIHQGQQIAGVLLVEYGAQWVAQFQAAVSADLGEVAVLQYVDNNAQYALDIFRVGQANHAGKRRIVPLIDEWYLSYVPNEERPQLALLPLFAPWVIVLAALALVLLGLVLLQNYEIRRNQLQLLTYVRQAQRGQVEVAPKFSLKLFYDLYELLSVQINRLHKASAEVASEATIGASAARSNLAAKSPKRPPEEGLIVEEIDDDSGFRNP